jgi:hypothetical protein
MPMRRFLPYIITALAIPALYFAVNVLVEDSKPAGHIYLLNGTTYTHTTKEGLDAHIDALWNAYCERHGVLMKSRLKSISGNQTGTLPPEMLKEILGRTQKSILSSTESLPENIPASKQKLYLEAYAGCVRAKLLKDGLDFIQCIEAANPSFLGTDPSGYYDDRNGGALCVVSNNSKFDVYVGAGRGPNYNSDSIDFSGVLKNGVIIGDPIPNQPDRKPELIVDKGMACLTGAGDRLDATYVRTGTLTKTGKDMVPSATLGSQVTDDAGGERYLKFQNTGINFFRPKEPEHPDLFKEAIILAGLKPDKDIK